MIRKSKTKVCSKCQKRKPLELFERRYDRPCGFRPECIECRRKYQSENHLKNSKRRNYISRLYYKNHKIEIKKLKKVWEIFNYKNNPRYRTTKILRRRMQLALKGKNKSLSTMSLIGCEIDYLMYYLQCQFKRGMNWDNHGEWVIDHIKPCKKFDLSKPSEQKKCFHYTNLQPLWKLDNLIKGFK